MGKLRFTLSIVGMLCAMCVAAAPATAWFQGATAQRGKGTAGKVVLSTATGVEEICESAEGGWEVWSKGTVITKGQQIQAEVTVGPHLLITVSKWNNCTVAIGAEAPRASTVSSCSFQLEQVSKLQTTGVTADVASECTITTGACVIKVPQATGGTNENLKEVKLLNNGANLEAKAEIGGGITANVNAGCKAIGIVATTNGNFHTIITGENLKEV